MDIGATLAAANTANASAFATYANANADAPYANDIMGAILADMDAFVAAASAAASADTRSASADAFRAEREWQVARLGQIIDADA